MDGLLLHILAYVLIFTTVVASVISVLLVDVISMHTSVFFILAMIS